MFARLEGAVDISIEREPDYADIAEKRIAEAQMQQRIAELTAHSDIERQDDKRIPEVQE